MAEKGTKKKAAKSKSQASDSGVLASLSATRPARLSRRGRDEAAAAKPKAAAKKKKQAAKKKPAKKPKPVAAVEQPRAKQAAAIKPVASVTQATPARPRAVRAGSHKLAEPARKSAGKRAPAPVKPPSGTELVTTVVQAAGELAQVGLTVSGQILKRAVEKLPKP